MTTASQSIVRTRFAPSPSGHLHVGGARTALFNWAFARHLSGKFILRIEDTDQKRSSGAASVGFLKDLKWLGINWDEGPVHEGVGGGDFGPYFQSERLATYTELAEKLIAEGKAYRAFETPEELDAARAEARNANTNYRHPRKILDDAAVAKLVSEGVPNVVRLKLPDDVASKLKFHDEVLGEITTEPNLIDDFVIVKADGYPTYHFAVVVDDALMHVSHVIRAQEHLNNTFKHILLQEALGFDRPKYAHVSIIFNPDGSKMSKRDKAKAVRSALRERAPTPQERSPIIRSIANRISMQYSKLLESARQSSVAGPVQVMTHDDEQLGVVIGEILDPSQLVSEDVETAMVRACAQFSDGETDNLGLTTYFAEYLGVQLPEINVDDFRKAGYLPEVMVNYLALLGWNPGGDQEKFDADELVKMFTLDRIIKSPAKFDRAKLLAFNLDALQTISPDEFAKRVREHGEAFHKDFVAKFPGEQFTLFATCNQARSKTLEDPFRSCRFFVMADDAIVYEESKPVRKALDNGEPTGLALLEMALPVFEAQDDWSHPALEAAVTKFVEQHAGGNLGRIAQPLRIAVTGGPVSPAIFETLSLLGKVATVSRIKRCIAWRQAIKV